VYILPVKVAWQHNDSALLRRGQVRPPQSLNQAYIAAAEPRWPRRQQARVMPPALHAHWAIAGRSNYHFSVSAP